MDDEQKREHIRWWLAQLEHDERVRILQLFAMQFGIEIPEEHFKRPLKDGLQEGPPIGRVNAIAKGRGAGDS